MNTGKRILVLDDEPGIRGAMVSALSLHGHRAFPAKNAEEALAFARQEPIDLVLTDLRLQGASGVEALGEIRKIRPQAKAILMTGYGTMESAVQALRLGASDYLTKPFRMDELLRSIERATSDSNSKRSFQASLPWDASFPPSESSKSAVLQEIACAFQAHGIPQTPRRRAMAAFGEILDNAIRHAGSGRQEPIHVCARIEGESICGRVDDRGPGFDASAATARALTRREARIGGIRFLHDSVDDLRIRATQGKGCSVEFRVALPAAASPSEVCLPPVPSGVAWQKALRQIRETGCDLRVDGTALEFLHPQAASQIQEALATARVRGHRVSLHHFCLAGSSVSLLRDAMDAGEISEVESADEDNLIRKALWA